MTNFSSTLGPGKSDNMLGLGNDGDSDVVPPAMLHRIIVAAILLIASVLGSVGNALVILAVVASKKLRTSTNAFVVNLAVADFLTSMFLPFLALSLVIDNDPAIPPWLCGTAMAFVYSCLGCSLYTLASIAINRLLLITKPTHVCKKLFQPKVLSAWISGIWMVTFAITVLPLMLNTGQLGYDNQYHICGGVSTHPKTGTYEAILVLGLYPIPLLLILVSYVYLYVHIRLHGRRMMGIRGEPNEMSSTATTKSASVADKRRIVPNGTPIVSETMSPVTSPIAKSPTVDSFDAPPGSRDITPDITPRPIRRQLTTTGDCTPTLGQMRKSARKKISKRHLQITKNLFYIVCAFLLCLTPYFIVFLVDHKGAGVIYAASAIFFNSCVNPFVYATKHPHFKKVFKCILRCNLKGVPEPADFLRSLDSIMKG
ncbi:putative alpha-1A adrenergic receptor-like [Apostichopus japonicus]|uniref:Putative alpha-1A adrenergic receptor-like n=1 Tax=Stichopus japonicus TaxID=307972 RepID=A0A2G8L141_STIJA|nr:putative alpha-1A adrenergic receptor-like [Apostichopus japonicus]